jgi:hypothetical protein
LIALISNAHLARELEAAVDTAARPSRALG